MEPIVCPGAGTMSALCPTTNWLVTARVVRSLVWSPTRVLTVGGSQAGAAGAASDLARAAANSFHTSGMKSLLPSAAISSWSRVGCRAWHCSSRPWGRCFVLVAMCDIKRVPRLLEAALGTLTTTRGRVALWLHQRFTIPDRLSPAPKRAGSSSAIFPGHERARRPYRRAIP